VVKTQQPQTTQPHIVPAQPGDYCDGCARRCLRLPGEPTQFLRPFVSTVKQRTCVPKYRFVLRHRSEDTKNCVRSIRYHTVRISNSISAGYAFRSRLAVCC
jgi:hypothetical protein